MSGRLALATMLGLALGASTALSQTGGLPFRDGSGPIEIAVDGSIEWQQKVKTFVARGNARARQDDVTLSADVITAHYRDSKDGGTEIWRIVADGNVRIASPDRTATGQKGSYDVDKQVLVLTGKPVFESGADRIAAEQSLEYWQARKLFVAKGDATATREDRTLKAGTLTATFEADGKDGDRIKRIEAVGNVIFRSPTELLRADRAAYDVVAERLTLEGSVQITQGQNRLTGQAAEMDLKTGISRLSGGQGTIMPNTVSRPDGKTDR